MKTVIRPETEMKDSSVQWIGDIPNDWDVRRLKYVLNERKEKNDPLVTDNILSLSAEQGVIPFSERIGGGNKPKEDLTAYKVVRAGDIVLNSMNVLSGAVHYSNYTGCVSPVYYMLYNENDVITRYYNLVFQTEAFQRSLRGLGNGILIRETDEGKLNTIRMRIPMEKLNKVKLPSPSFDEMKKVVEFIEPIRSKIDEIIAEAKASIDEYKELKQSVLCDTVLRGLNSQIALKNSGASWIGMIPEHWKTVKLKWHLRRMDPKNPGEKEVLSLYRDYGVIPKNSRNDNHNVTSEDTSKYKYVRVGDFVVNKMKAWQGSVAVSDYEGIVSPAYYVYHFLDDVFNKRYFHHLLRSCYKEEFMRLSGGIRIGQWDLSSNALDNIILLVPPKNEQDDIVEYLDNKLPQIDALIAEKESLINDLEAYKKSLIYEVVTGKRRVV